MFRLRLWRHVTTSSLCWRGHCDLECALSLLIFCVRVTISNETAFTGIITCNLNLLGNVMPEFKSGVWLSTDIGLQQKFCRKPIRSWTPENCQNWPLYDLGYAFIVSFCFLLCVCLLFICFCNYAILLVQNNELECGPMPNIMAALPNIGGALCSTPQSLADAHWSAM